MRMMHVLVYAIILLAHPVHAEEDVLLEQYVMEEDFAMLCPEDGIGCTYFVRDERHDGMDCLDSYDEKAYAVMEELDFTPSKPRYEVLACDVAVPENIAALCIRRKEDAELKHCFVGYIGDERWYFSENMRWAPPTP